jgi:hypothetical protein
MRIGGIKSKDNTADILTKFLQPDLHREHTRYLFPIGLPLTPRMHTNNLQQQQRTQPTTTLHQQHQQQTHLPTFASTSHAFAELLIQTCLTGALTRHPSQLG